MPPRFLLVVVILLLNIVAIRVRNGLREKYRGFEIVNDQSQFHLEAENLAAGSTAQETPMPEDAPALLSG